MLEICYNIYIDEFGYVYLVGCNLNSGGMFILNVDMEDGELEFVVFVLFIYVYDVYVVSNKMYFFEIYVGNMIVYDVIDKENIQVFGIKGIFFFFIYNIWLNELEIVAFIMDEVVNVLVVAYDIIDFFEIEELD